MKKSLNKCYLNLDLPYSASIEDVLSREKALIKILQSKEKEKNISCEKEIQEIEFSAKAIVENIKVNGIPNEKEHRFEASNESIFGLFVVFAFVALICFFSFYILM